MIEATISHVNTCAQQTDNIYCPMCEAFHENNTWCQATFGDSYGWGGCRMKTPLYRYRPLVDAIDDLLSQRKSWDDLTETDIQTLAGYALQGYGRDAWECLAEADGLDDIVQIAATLMTRGYGRTELAETVAARITDYLHDRVRDIYTDRQVENNAERKIEAGLRLVTDKINGEISWIRA